MAAFDWLDPFHLAEELTDDERQVQQAAHEYCQGRLMPRILEANPGQVAAYKDGKEGLLGYFVGQVMKETGGKANARAVSELVRARLQ